MADKKHKEEPSGLLTEIHRSSFHDGPGVRTVFFFKGCPLHCAWCHNPESLSFNNELRCRKDPVNPYRRIEEWAGKSYTLTELVKEAEKDRSWYDSTCGGVTLSGGEALAQGELVLALLNALGPLGIHRAVETSGTVNRGIWLRSLEYTDLYLFDWKCSDRESLKKWTGADFDLIKESLEILIAHNKSIYLRIPLIPGVNDNELHWDTIAYWARFDQVKKVEIMGYHNWGRDRYPELGRPLPPEFPVPTKENLSSWKERLGQKINKEKLVP